METEVFDEGEETDGDKKIRRLCYLAQRKAAGLSLARSLRCSGVIEVKLSAVKVGVE